MDFKIYCVNGIGSLSEYSVEEIISLPIPQPERYANILGGAAILEEHALDYYQAMLDGIDQASSPEEAVYFKENGMEAIAYLAALKWLEPQAAYEVDVAGKEILVNEYEYNGPEIPHPSGIVGAYFPKRYSAPHHKYDLFGV